MSTAVGKSLYRQVNDMKIAIDKLEQADPERIAEELGWILAYQEKVVDSDMLGIPSKSFPGAWRSRFVKEFHASLSQGWQVKKPLRSLTSLKRRRASRASSSSSSSNNSKRKCSSSLQACFKVRRAAGSETAREVHNWRKHGKCKHEDNCRQKDDHKDVTAKIWAKQDSSAQSPRKRKMTQSIN